MRILLFTLGVFLAAGDAPAQFYPEDAPTHAGARATADLPKELHKRNTGGMGPGGPGTGYGLCVYTSFWHAAMWQYVPEMFGFRDWMTRREGGSFPQKFDADVAAFCREKNVPVPAYIQHTGGDVEFLKLALKTGRMVCITYCGVDDFYGNNVIAHMVNLAHLDDEWACVIDNNRPGKFVWMSAPDLVARWQGRQRDGRSFMVRSGARMVPVGGGWAFVLLEGPPPPYAGSPPAVAVCPCGGGCKCEPGKCPSQCPAAEQVIFGQYFPNCPNGQCPLQPRATPVRFPAPAAPPASGKLEDLGPVPVGPPPGPNYEWGFFPDLGVHGWKLKAKKVDAVPPPGVFGQDPFPGGIDPEKLTNLETYSLSGTPIKKCDYPTLLSDASGLADDSGKWNLAVVGDAAFCAKVRGDVAKLDRSVSEKLHVKCYPENLWAVKQFGLSPGVVLRTPAQGRVAKEAGVIALPTYTTGKLDDLLAPVSGKAPDPMPSPRPSPPDDKTPPAPVKNWDWGKVLAGLAVLALLFLTRK